MNSRKVYACQSSLLASSPGTIVSNIKGYGSETSHGDSMDWLTAWSLCCGFSLDEDVTETVDDCLHYGKVTRFSVPADFREKVHRLCLSLGISSKAHVGMGDRFDSGVANVTISIPENFVWSVPDFERVKQSNYVYEASKSSKKFDYAMDIHDMNNVYPAIRELITKRGDKDCTPRGRCLSGYRTCSICSGADDDIMRLSPEVRMVCISRLVEEGVVHPYWGDGIPMRYPRYIDEYA